MSKVTKTTRVEVEQTEVISLVCDWCGNGFEDPHSPETREFYLSFDSGYSEYGDTYGEGWIVEDLCNDCVKKLRKLLEDAGIKVRELNW